jgi:hypothetical protein
VTLLVSVAVALLAIPSAIFALEIAAALTAARRRAGGASGADVAAADSSGAGGARDPARVAADSSGAGGARDPARVADVVAADSMSRTAAATYANDATVDAPLVDPARVAGQAPLADPAREVVLAPSADPAREVVFAPLVDSARVAGQAPLADPAREAVLAPLADSARVAILVPAHDEAAGIAATLATLTPQLRAGDRLLVVADNCSDDTAAVARAAGAEVVERSDAARAGKGWALAAGVVALAAQPPDVVIIVDADCDVAPGTIDTLRGAGRAAPAQAVYLMLAPDDAPQARRLAELLFTVRNWARPLGLAQLGAPCLLTGAGMALPWTLARAAPLGSGSVVEDVQLAIDLAVAGTPPRFCPGARVTSFFPARERAAEAQRTRWLWGHLRTMLQAPRLIVAAARHRSLGLLLLACELAVPPLSLLFPLWTLTAAAALAIGLTNHEWRPFFAAVAGAMTCALAVVAAWWRFARDRVPLRVVLAAPLYALPTIKSALVALVRRRQRWNRTARD